MMDWLSFYVRFFGVAAKAERFVEACEAQTPPNNVAKIIMHQAQRLISLAEEITGRSVQSAYLLQVFFPDRLRRGCRETLRWFKCLARIAPGGARFFLPTRPRADIDPVLGDGFTTVRHEALGPRGAADLLYDVRCSVAHEGDYWTFAMGTEEMPMISVEPEVIVTLTAEGMGRDRRPRLHQCG